MAFPFALETATDVVVDVWPPPGGIMLWIDNKQISRARSEKIPGVWMDGPETRIVKAVRPRWRKGKHRLYASSLRPR